MKKKQEITTIRTSSEYHIHWKEHFHKNPFYFGIIGFSKADIEIDSSSMCNKTTSFYNQNQCVMVIV